MALTLIDKLQFSEVTNGSEAVIKTINLPSTIHGQSLGDDIDGYAMLIYEITTIHVSRRSSYYFGVNRIFLGVSRCDGYFRHSTVVDKTSKTAYDDFPGTYPVDASLVLAYLDGVDYSEYITIYLQDPSVGSVVVDSPTDWFISVNVLGFDPQLSVP